MAFQAKCKFTDGLVRPRKVYGPRLQFSLTNQSVNLHIAVKTMFYLLSIYKKCRFKQVCLFVSKFIVTYLLKGLPCPCSVVL